ncbi:MAG: hypothetical protein ACR2RE_22970, partial [Geminicoccaceae bacterium]
QKAYYEAKIAVVNQAQEQAKAERATQLAEAKRVNAQKLLQNVPEWQDVQTQQQDLAEINAMGVKAGYWTSEAFNEGISTTPHWQIELWREAMLRRRERARQKGKTNGATPVTKRVTKVQPTVKSQASQPQSTRPRKAEDAALRRFQSNPNEAAAVDVLMAKIDRKGARHRRA